MVYYCKTLHYSTMYFNNSYYRYFRFFLQGKCVPIQQLAYKVIQPVVCITIQVLFNNCLFTLGDSKYRKEQ